MDKQYINILHAPNSQNISLGKTGTMYVTLAKYSGASFRFIRLSYKQQIEI